MAHLRLSHLTICSGYLLLCNKPLKNITAENSLLVLYLTKVWVRDSQRASARMIGLSHPVKSGASTGVTPIAESQLGSPLCLLSPRPTPWGYLNGLSRDMLTSRMVRLLTLEQFMTLRAGVLRE